MGIVTPELDKSKSLDAICRSIVAGLYLRAESPMRLLQ